MVGDLTKVHIDNFINTLGQQRLKTGGDRAIASAKSRNHYRTVIRQFLCWSVRKDYLPANHLLFEADAMRQELANTSAIEFYTPEEFEKLLKAAKGELADLLSLVAIGGLAGLRQLKLTIEDVLDTLPPVYDRPLYAQKCSALFEHVFESYPESEVGIYSPAS
jgi:hypothetical protein